MACVQLRHNAAPPASPLLPFTTRPADTQHSFVLSHHDPASSVHWPSVTPEGLEVIPQLVQEHAAFVAFQRPSIAHTDASQVLEICSNRPNNKDDADPNADNAVKNLVTIYSSF